MSGPSELRCAGCESRMSPTTPVCPTCGLPRATGQEKKRELYRFALAVAASIAVLVCWQWWRGSP